MKTSLINHIFLAMVFVISLNRQSCIAKTIPYSQGNVEKPATVQVKVVDTDKRQRRYIDQFPDQLDVDVSTDELHEHFQNLKRNHHVPHIKYVHMMENGAVKKFRFERKETMAYYIDVEHVAAFEVSLASEGSEDFDIYGTFVSKQHKYLVQPPRDNRSTYTVSLMEEKLPTSIDYIKLSDTDAKITEGKMQNRSEQTINTREKRQTTDYEMEIFFVIDFGLYKWTYALTEGENDRHTATVNKLLQFTSFMLNEDPSDSRFVEDHVINDAGEADGDKMLYDFRKWGESSLRRFNYDHAALLTGRDIGYIQDGKFHKGLLGVAYVPSIPSNGELGSLAVCGVYAYSINEMTAFKPSMGTTITHEIGHNSRNCMTARTATGNDDIDPYANDLAGQVYNPDTQCEMMVGKGSFLNRNKYKSDFSTICSVLFCAIQGRDGSAITKIPWYGTTCGNGKMCQLGHCVESPLAPTVADEACPFGDTPDIVPHKTSGCSDVLGSPATTYNCYHEAIRKHCCGTCEAIKKTNRAYVDCDYGDKQSYCVGMSLQQCRNNLETCCKTCQDIRLDIPDCPWGDEYTDCTQSHCTNDTAKCCQTCTPTTTPSAKSSRVQVSPALLFCLFLYQFYSGIMSIC
ncbi:uncharacterized protein LOC132745835 isoform X2 [Ruditapes philippinarum]|uniref:uncharacterized protein LOC132745835 isoform X2 n=1 Tax=Ruditapes philippinarum TaxID=129788 RepID=UPI00295B36DE|nr:uncharacterized protein LOC132745835 isoform X2 [Ruditapes philippinarum]